MRTIRLLMAVGALTIGALTPAMASGHQSTGDDSPRSASAAGRLAVKNPCSDHAFSLIGGLWSHTVHWTFNAGSTPAGQNVDNVEAALVRSFDNITKERNDCGRADKVSATNSYDGRTARAPGINKNGQCSGSDGKNAVGFGRLPAGILAVTCTRRFGGFIVEADIRISTRFNWAATVAECNNQELIEPTITHEVGHVYGLGHVGERRHPLLTMSTQSDGPCNNAASTLAAGDMDGLEQLY